jgi:hypothetical protein
MRRSILLLAAAGLIAATPAVAGDLLYPGGTLLTEGVAGQPYWAVQARCAGVYGAASNYLVEKGQTDAAAEAKALGVAFLHDAIDRVMKDRGVPRPAALEALGPAVVAGRSEALGALQAEGDGPTSRWNYARSACLDIRDAYAAQ